MGPPVSFPFSFLYAEILSMDGQEAELSIDIRMSIYFLQGKSYRRPNLAHGFSYQTDSTLDFYNKNASNGPLSSPERTRDLPRNTY